MVSEVRRIPKKTFVPVEDKLALHIFRVEETEGGIVIPDAARDRIETETALVIAVGPDVKYVMEGDRVLLPAGHMFQKVRHLGQETAIFREKDIVGVVNKEDL